MNSLTYYHFPQRRGWKLFFGIFLTAMLFLCRDTMVSAAMLGVEKALLVSLGLICLAGLIFLLANRKNLRDILRDPRMAAVLISTVLILGPMAAKQDWQLMYFSVLLCLYFAIFLTYFISFTEVAKYYVVILSILGIYSVLATYLFRIPVDSKILNIPVFKNAIGYKFYNFGLAFVSKSYVKNRNFGIFREPGVYQFFILIALYLNNDWVSWKKKWQMWLCNGLLAVTMLSTFATGGVIELGLLAVVLFIHKKWYKDKRICGIAIALVTVVSAVVIVSIVQKNSLYRELYGMIVDKFSGNTESMSDRTGAIALDLGFLISHPLFGEKLSTVLHAMENNTTSTMILYAVFGAVSGSLNVAAWVALVWKKDRSVWINLALLVILFMSFNTQNLIADVFFWLFPYMALVERGLPLVKWKKKV